MAEENKSHRASDAADAQNKFESSKVHARKAAEDLRDAAGAIAGEYRGKAEQAWNETRGKAENARGITSFDRAGRRSAGRFGMFPPPGRSHDFG